MPEIIVERKPRPRDRVLIRLSGGRFFALPEERAAPLIVGAELSDEEIAQLSLLDGYLRGRDKAMRMLAVRARTRREVDGALRAMSLPAGVVAGLLSELEELGLIDDTRFAREFVSVRKDVRRAGPHRLRADLRRLGVGSAVTEQALATYTPDEQEIKARELVERVARGAVFDEKLLRRIIGMLQRKGFDHAVVNRVAYDFARKARRGDLDGAGDAWQDE